MAHQASGIRGDLIRLLEMLTQRGIEDDLENPGDLQRLKYLMGVSFEILEKAARELM